MMQQRDINKIQAIIFLQRLYAYLLVLKYLNQLTKTKNADESYTNDSYPFLRGAKAYLNGDSTRTLRFRHGRTYTFDSNGRLIEKRDRNDNWVIITRDSLGNITGLIDSFGRSLYITNRGVQIGNTIYTVISSVSDVIGRTVTYAYEKGKLWGKLWGQA